ncbi:MAG TPA: tetratricopeptide repeat protein [Candidatus Acidoferrales bacterium]|nr:tetratricopeptide repeat protein [Candidatus Acidoferrales bacterium]
MKRSIWMLAAAIGCLTACSAGLRLPPTAPERPADLPAAMPNVERPEATPPKPAILEDAPLPPLSPAAQALMRQVEAQRAQGQMDAAAATAERALRLAPTHPEPWLSLAGIRLAQQRAEQAEAMARRALSLGGKTRAIRYRAWSVIAEARQMQGDSAGAREARDRADRDA